MFTKNDTAVPAQLVSAENGPQFAARALGNRCVRPIFWGLGAAALMAAVAYSQVAPLQIIPLADGSSLEREVEMHVKGPTDVLQTDLIFQPGGTTGWHIHPGPVIVVVKTGALTEIRSNGCVTVHNANSAFFEPANEVHNVINETGVVTEVYATFLSPAGAQPLIPVPDPGNNTCRSGH